MEVTSSGNDAQDHWARVRDLFGQLVLLSADSRDVFLQKIGDEDLELRKQLEVLLAEDSSDKACLTSAVSDAVELIDEDRRRQLIGTSIGPYRIKSILGHGGSGTVYLAERIDKQYSIQVAIKVIESLGTSETLLQRFRAERQILARLNHPYIARLIDAGETAEGLAYIVMEYVKGERIDQYCDSKNLTIQSRLELFAKICEAVRFAHQNLVLHRDLKPANILVTDDGTPKLLDFGVAKLLDPTDELASLALTQHNDRPLTPEYASPEQILGQSTSTSSDVYTLGVVLYELLTGSRPYALYSSDRVQLQTAICSADPLKPSETLRIDEATASSVAANRSTTVVKLKRALAGDIDAIVLRALRREPDKRYGSIEQLASDISKHLGGEPVSARRGNKLYYASRFLRKHGFITAVGVAATSLLVVFAIYTWIQSLHIAAERDRAEIVSSFMLDVFGATDPYVTQGKEVTARELLDKATARIDSELSNQPEIRAQLMNAMGEAYRSQGQPERAIPYLKQALIYYRNVDVMSMRAVRILQALGRAELAAGDLSSSLASLNEAADWLERTGNQHTFEYIRVLRSVASLKHNQGNLDSARRYYLRALALSTEVLGKASNESAEIMVELANSVAWLDDWAQSEQLLRKALGIYSTKGNEGNPSRLYAQASLGSVLLWEGRITEAEVLLQHSARDHEKIFGKRSWRLEKPLINLSELRRIQGRYADAEAAIREALYATEQSLGPHHFEVGSTLTYLTVVLLEEGKKAEAEQTARNALKIVTSSLGPDHQYVAAAEYELGLVLLVENKLVESDQILKSSLARWQVANAPRWRAARSQSALGEVLFKRGQLEEGKKDLQQSYDVLLQDLGASHEETRIAKTRIERCLPRTDPRPARTQAAAVSPTN